jgi:uncharacterized protein
VTAEPLPRPDPTPTAITQHFWDSTAKHRLAFQRCRACTRPVFPPRGHCPHCWQSELDWKTSSGRAILASKTVVHRPGHVAFAHDVPYTVALVDLEEGFRMLSNVVGAGHEDTPIGAQLKVTWGTRGRFTLPQFVRAQGEANA